MNVFISYSGSAQDAEKELCRIVSERADAVFSDWGRAAGDVETDSWSRMLPGVVCDLGPQISDCTLFIALLGDRTLVSCELEDGHEPRAIPSVGRLSGLQREDRDVRHYLSPGYSEPTPSVYRIVDGSMSVRHIPLDRPVRRTWNWNENTGSSHIDDATAGAIIELVCADDRHVDNRLIDFLMLVFKARDHSNNPSLLRKITKELNCRLAWSSMRMVDRGLSHLPIPSSNFKYFPDISQQEDSHAVMKAFRSFWERNSSSPMRTFDYTTLRYSSLVERREVHPWPSLLQFMVFVSNVGRRANERLRARGIPNVLRRRKGVKRRIRAQESLSSSDELISSGSGSLKTLAQLFAGHEAGPLIAPELRRRSRRFARRKEMLLKIERALYVAGTDTILSLYRGQTCPVSATVRKRHWRS